MEQYDIIVVGGGTSGVMATIAAARMGAKVLLIEKDGFLGGVMTGANVGPMMTFHAGEDQVIQGIMGELIDRLVERGYSVGHIPDSTGFTYSVTPFDAEGLKRIEEEMIIESGGHILFHTMLAEVSVKDQQVDTITVCNKSGLSKYKATCYIDATGDGDLSVWAGVPFTKGRTDGEMQPVTLMLKMNGVDIDKVKAYVKDHPEEFPRLNGNTEQVIKANRLSLAGFEKSFHYAKANKIISTEREDVLFFETNTKGEVIFNTTRILGCDATDPISLSHAEIEGRKQAMEIARYAKEYLAGFDKAQVVVTGPNIGIRSSRQIIGHYTLTTEDLMVGFYFEDTIATGGYPIDIHSPDGAGTKVVQMPYGHQYYIPYSTLTNDVVNNLITVGRCISATFEAQSAIRVSPIMGAVGQAGGVAAALYTKNCYDKAKDVPCNLLRTELLKQRAYLGQDKNV